MAIVHVWADSREMDQLGQLREMCARKWPAATLYALRPKYFAPNELPPVDKDGKQTGEEEVVAVATTSDRVDIIQAYEEIGVEVVTVASPERAKIAAAVEPEMSATPVPATADSPALRDAKQAGSKTGYGTQVDAEAIAAIIARPAVDVMEAINALEEPPFILALREAEQRSKRPRVTVLRAIADKLGDEGEA